MYFVFGCAWSLRLWGVLAATSGGSCLAAACGLPMAVAWVAVEHGFSCSLAHGIFLEQELNLCPLHYKVEC